MRHDARNSVSKTISAHELGAVRRRIECLEARLASLERTGAPEVDRVAESIAIQREMGALLRVIAAAEPSTQL
jgi:hypothetical protein